MIEFIMKGGVLIYPIFLSSIIALGVFLEKILSLQTKKVIPPEFLNNLRELVKENKISLALDYCIENDSSMARISIAGLRYFGKDKLEIRYALEEAGRQEVKNLL